MHSHRRFAENVRLRDGIGGVLIISHNQSGINPGRERGEKVGFYVMRPGSSSLQWDAIGPLPL
jgi:hypothetical protein